MQDIETITKRLADPFPATDIEWRIGATNDRENPTKGIALAYITNRAVQQRLDDVVGIDNWRNEYREWKDKATLCGISIRINNEWITKWDGADDSEMEAIKGGLSDAMKRAAYQWGIGRYLYNLESVWAPVEKRGKSAFLKGDPPKLPDWALPENERGKGTQKQPPTKPEPAMATEAQVQDILAKFPPRGKQGWKLVYDMLKPMGLALTQTMTAEQKKELITAHLRKLSDNQAKALLGGLNVLPLEEASA